MKFLLAYMLLGLGSVEFSKAESSPMTVAQAVEFCEREVPNYCIQTTCPIFCNVLRTETQRTKCNSGCTTTNRCKVSSDKVSSDQYNNAALDTQNWDQLLACIAEKRDPNAQRTTPWKDIRTENFLYATRP